MKYQMELFRIRIGIGQYYVFEKGTKQQLYKERNIGRKEERNDEGVERRGEGRRNEGRKE